MGQALNQGRLITFEGGEGAGKTTQIALLAAALQRNSIDAIATREPGGSPGGEAIRQIFLAGTVRWDAECEALLMAAARRSHLVATIWPAITAGRIVLCDRFADSTEAYQGWGRGLPREPLMALHRLIAGDFRPALTLIFDLPVAEGLARTAARAEGLTRFERMPPDFHERVRQGFLDISRREPHRCVVIDARPDQGAVHAAVLAAVRERLALKLD